MMDWDGGMSDGWWVLMAIFWIALLGLIAWGIARFSSRPARDEATEPRRESAADELDRRLARGDIDVETYDEVRARLDRTRSPTPGA